MRKSSRADGRDDSAGCYSGVRSRKLHFAPSSPFIGISAFYDVYTKKASRWDESGVGGRGGGIIRLVHASIRATALKNTSPRKRTPEEVGARRRCGSCHKGLPPPRVGKQPPARSTPPSKLGVPVQVLHIMKPNLFVYSRVRPLLFGSHPGQQHHERCFSPGDYTARRTPSARQ